jgi:acetyl-CoA C-acetyltransferase
MMPEAYIVDAVRTPVGRSAMAGFQDPPADLGAHSLNALMDRTGIDPHAVEDVIFGCVDTLGPQAGDIARTAWLAAGLPEEVPGTTIDRQCGSSQQAVHFAAQAVMSGTSDVIVAGGVQNMSHDPDLQRHDAGRAARLHRPVLGFRRLAQALWRRAGLAVQLGRDDRREVGRSREDMEQFAYNSHMKAIRAIDEGRFVNEIAPIAGMFRR